MEYSSHSVTVDINFAALQSNFTFLNDARRKVQGAFPFEHIEEKYGISLPSVLAVVKSDAYGHGHIETALALAKAGATAFASGSVEEAVMLRLGLKSAEAAPEIFSLLGPITVKDFVLAAEHKIIPLIHNFDQLSLLEHPEVLALGTRPRLNKRPILPVAVKCNSGMSRLGFNEAELDKVLERLRGHNTVVPVVALSHFACADSVDGPRQMEAQAQVFAGMLRKLRAEWPVAASLCNSAGTLQAEYVDGIIGPHICRPGVAVYGINPLRGTPYEARGEALITAMTVKAPVIAVRTLHAGEPLGYGFTWKAERDTPVAIIACGYADYLSRGLSNKGQVSILGTRAKIVGRVAMQMTAVDISEAVAAGFTVKPGAMAYLLGGEGAFTVSAYELADIWGTIPYEVLCLLGMNAKS
jgi:alanine racemase